VLIGTRSIDKSNILASMLRQQGMKVQILNANEIEREAEIVALAGEQGQITVATNMAGRGTDVKLRDEVRAIGGMMVICTGIARRGPYRPPAHRTLRTPGGPRHIPSIPGHGRRNPPKRLWPETLREIQTHGRARTIQRLDGIPFS